MIWKLEPFLEFSWQITVLVSVCSSSWRGCTSRSKRNNSPRERTSPKEVNCNTCMREPERNLAVNFHNLRYTSFLLEMNRKGEVKSMCFCYSKVSWQISPLLSLTLSLSFNLWDFSRQFPFCFCFSRLKERWREKEEEILRRPEQHQTSGLSSQFLVVCLFTRFGEDDQRKEHSSGIQVVSKLSEQSLFKGTLAHGEQLPTFPRINQRPINDRQEIVQERCGSGFCGKMRLVNAWTWRNSL